MGPALCQCTIGGATWIVTHKKNIKGIKKLPHFRFDHLHTGEVFVETKCGEQEKSHNIPKSDQNFSASSLPPVINHPGLPAEWQQYLYDKIREFCPEKIVYLISDSTYY